MEKTGTEEGTVGHCEILEGVSERVRMGEGRDG